MYHYWALIKLYSRPRLPHYPEVSGAHAIKGLISIITCFTEKVHIRTGASLGYRDRAPGVHWIGGWMGPKSRSGCCVVEANLLPLPGVSVLT
jgi:hypothetical protein